MEVVDLEVDIYRLSRFINLNELNLKDNDTYITNNYYINDDNNQSSSPVVNDVTDSTGNVGVMAGVARVIRYPDFLRLGTDPTFSFNPTHHWYWDFSLYQ